jgi:hypothetical protein
MVRLDTIIKAIKIGKETGRYSKKKGDSAGPKQCWGPCGPAHHPLKNQLLQLAGNHDQVIIEFLDYVRVDLDLLLCFLPISLFNRLTYAR